MIWRPFPRVVAEPELDFTYSFPRARSIGPRTIVAREEQRGAARGIRRIGMARDRRADFYHRALTLSWTQFMLRAAAVYFTANTMFACLYLLQPGSISSATRGSFWDAFFFSVQTFGTIGYGVLSPATRYANFIVTLETLTGIMLVALTTGLMFARVSRPTARVLFAKIAVVSPSNGVRTLMVRMANERTSQIIEASVGLSLVRNERTQEGSTLRRFYALRLEREHTPVFAMSFLAMHRIDETSPLFGVTQEILKEWEAEILATVTGLDETMSQTIHARASYLPAEVLLGRRYVDIFGQMPDGARAIDYRRFHETEAVEQP